MGKIKKFESPSFHWSSAGTSFNFDAGFSPAVQHYFNLLIIIFLDETSQTLLSPERPCRLVHKGKGSARLKSSLGWTQVRCTFLFTAAIPSPGSFIKVNNYMFTVAIPCSGSFIKVINYKTDDCWKKHWPNFPVKFHKVSDVKRIFHKVSDVKMI